MERAFVVVATHGLLGLVLSAQLLCADALPTYSYFYTCTSDVVNCGGFGTNFHGDFGLNGLTPSNLPTNEPSQSHIVSSNSQGEVLGVVDGFALNGITYGADGVLSCVIGCEDAQQNPVSINENGIFLFNLFEWPVIGNSAANVEPVTVSPALEAQISAQYGVPLYDFPNSLEETISGFALGYGLNDFNQVLVKLQTDSGTIEGVLSPNAVPELPSIALLASALGLLGLGTDFVSIRIRSRRL